MSDQLLSRREQGVDSESVAYLVMEYLDGCTLSEVLAEKSRLPVQWSSIFSNRSAPPCLRRIGGNYAPKSEAYQPLARIQRAWRVSC